MTSFHSQSHLAPSRRSPLAGWQTTAAFASLLALGGAAHAQHQLTTGTGDGSVTVTVDGYGAFGASIGTDASDAIYDPVGPLPAAGTVFESGIAFRLGGSGARAFLTSGGIGESGNLPPAPITGTPTTAFSGFTIGGLNVVLNQSLAPLFNEANERLGSQLVQSYIITNPGTAPATAELVRYVDGDLQFDGSIDDGGGRLMNGTTEFLFETDATTAAFDPTTFVGISAEGGTVPASGRFEVDAYSGLRTAILSGTALTNSVAGDGADADQFVDAGQPYDVSLALNNLLTLAPNATLTYTTRTVFGSGEPGNVPEPAAAALMLGVAAAAGGRRRRVARR